VNNYKGIYYGDDNKKYQDDDTGAHFEYQDICKRLGLVLQIRRRLDEKD
jgi:hypothetical protein